MRNVLISVSKDVIFFLKNDHGLCSGHQCHYRQLNHEKAHYSKIFKKHKVSSYSKKRKERKRKRPAKFQNRNRFGLRWREKGKKKTRTHCIKCTLVHIANLVLHLGMKPFPLKCWPRNYGQLSWKKLTKNKEGFLPRSRLAGGNLNKVPSIASIKQKVISSLEDIASNSKVYIDKKAKYVMPMLPRQHIFYMPTEYNCMWVLSTGNDPHNLNLFSCISSNLWFCLQSFPRL